MNLNKIDSPPVLKGSDMKRLERKSKNRRSFSSKAESHNSSYHSRLSGRRTRQSRLEKDEKSREQARLLVTDEGNKSVLKKQEVTTIDSKQSADANKKVKIIRIVEPEKSSGSSHLIEGELAPPVLLKGNKSMPMPAKSPSPTVRPLESEHQTTIEIEKEAGH